MQHKDIERWRMDSISTTSWMMKGQRWRSRGCSSLSGRRRAKCKPTRAMHPGLPWASMIGMRNKLIHAYFYVDLRVILETIQDDLPPLIDQIKDILKAQ